jgi:hypothetical protein
MQLHAPLAVPYLLRTRKIQRGKSWTEYVDVSVLNKGMPRQFSRGCIESGAKPIEGECGVTYVRPRRGDFTSCSLAQATPSFHEAEAPVS